MRKYLWLITAFVFVCFCAAVHSQEDTEGVKKLSPAERVDELFSQWDSAESPGAAIIVVKDGMVVFRGGYVSFTTSTISFRIPFSAASGLLASQLKLGNSAHKPTYSLSSSDQVTLYV